MAKASVRKAKAKRKKKLLGKPRPKAIKGKLKGKKPANKAGQPVKVTKLSPKQVTEKLATMGEVSGSAYAAGGEDVGRIEEVVAIPTPDQCKEEAKKLWAMKPRVRETTLFGDDNHAALEAEAKVLNEGMSEDQIHDQWGEDANEADEHVLNHALTVYKWMHEGDVDGDGSPSFQWEAIAKKSKPDSIPG